VPLDSDDSFRFLSSSRRILLEREAASIAM
jgi:hypothetical protein